MAEKILIIDDDIDTLKLVGLMLQKQGYQIVAAPNGQKGIAQAEAENPDLILLDVMMPDMDGYEVAKRLRTNPFTASIPILMFTAKTQLDDKVTGFEAGADDYLTKPTHPTELHAHVKALLARSPKGKAPAAATAAAEKRAFTIGVLAARGGLGVTTTAANLGTSLHQASHEEVIVAELRPGMGTLGPDLGEPHPRVLTELLQANLTDMNRQKVKEALRSYEDGLKFLYGSVQPKDGILMNSTEAFEALVNRLSFLARYLILDLGAGLLPLTQKLITACHQILVVVEPVNNSVIHTKALLSDLVDLGFNKRTIQVVVVSRIRSDTQLNWSQIEEMLGQSPIVAITPAPELIYMAARMKTTAVGSRPDSLTTQQFAKLASTILEVEKQQP
jgi:DNA-binding response OmpR family regulator